ncbi:hypothetical protein A3A03_03420 [Candidatus Nomurabacteria bacterium RIFCSPLOWO2_01_FULL_40_18]|uniref:Uncharacterized protein n=1 Tax=Candidatus Nomurabacteria bacterium RIFCSPLOWO2_01_FULL_40_18 TaxID=1801773 RepID=A0A1F6XK44_9BACT|nr:MAG: hypothetical protein A3A03_03420 [Candidatus Nomurabacteria bacterium RIFCSPLOWO2_01_FULL_40_18]
MNKGFMALISVVIISAILLLVAISLSNTSFYGRSNILDSELKEKSSALAEACVDVAILKLTDNSSYSPIDEFVNVGSEKCTIDSISVGNPKIIKVMADYQHYITKLEIEIDSDLSIIRFEEK